MSLMFFFRGFYASIIALYFLNSVFTAFFRIHFVQHLYILLLESLFTYAASVHQDHGSSTLQSLRCDSADVLESYEDDLIKRDIQLTEGGVKVSSRLMAGEQKGFKLHHPIYLVRCGIEAIIEDSVTKRFSAAQLRVWNFLARNPYHMYAKKNERIIMPILWFIGFCFRYIICLPCKTVTFLASLFITYFMGICGRKFPVKSIRRWCANEGLQSSIRLNLCPFSAVVRFHNVENRPKPNTICVANHTTPFDWAVLASDVTYAVVGQEHAGFFGLVEKIIEAAVPTVWFNRDEVLDRSLTAKRLKEHVQTPDAVPLLIFPEGTCINNTSVLKFRKGCFEVGTEIHPVAIKYHPLFADCFWNSSQDGLLKYTFKILSSWAMVADVWYLPPTFKQDDEDGIAFAKRVQLSIAECGGLTNVDWDGELKRRRPKEAMMLAQQKYISHYVLP